MKCNSFSVTLAILASVTTFAATIDKRADLQPKKKLPSTWRYAGCHADNVSRRTLDSSTYANDTSMTGENCIKFCGAKGYTYAGTEYSKECWCGLGLGSAMSYPKDCTMACTGDSTQACGGPDRLTVYANDGLPPTTNPGVNGFVSQGCYTDDVSARTLTASIGVEGQMTAAKCIAKCKANGYIYAGVEYACECYCGNAILNNAHPATSGCDSTCNGNITEFCGGSNRINLYKLMPTPTPTPSSSTPPSVTSTSPPATTEYVADGDFELGSGAWQVTGNPFVSNRGEIYFQGYVTGSAYNGTHFWIILDESDDSGKRSLCISQRINHSKVGTYMFSAAIGRGARSSTSTDTITYDVIVDSTKLATGSTCMPGSTTNPCTAPDISGQLTYRLVTFSVDITAATVGYHTLFICATYTDTGYHDSFKIDTVSIQGPK